MEISIIQHYNHKALPDQIIKAVFTVRRYGYELAISDHQMRVGWSKMEIFASFARYIFRTFTPNTTFIILYYVAH